MRRLWRSEGRDHRVYCPGRMDVRSLFAIENNGRRISCVLEAYMMSDDGNRLYAKQAWPVERVLSALMAALLAAILLILWRAMHSLGILKQAAFLWKKEGLGRWQGYGAAARRL